MDNNDNILNKCSSFIAYHKSFIESLYVESLSMTHDKNAIEQLKNELNVDYLSDIFGSTFTDGDGQVALIIDGPYDPAISQVWGIYECPICKTRRMGLQIIGNTIHFSKKHPGVNAYYKPINLNLTWGQARKEKVDDKYNIFGFGKPIRDSYGNTYNDITFEMVTNYIDYLDNLIIEKEKKEKEKYNEIQKEHNVSFENDLNQLIENNPAYIPSRVITRYKRNVKLVSYLKSKYTSCMLCGYSFKKKNGEPYTEIHHVISLSNNGKDDKINTLVLCANCHRQMHYADVDISRFFDGIIRINGVDKKILNEEG